MSGGFGTESPYIDPHGDPRPVEPIRTNDDPFPQRPWSPADDAELGQRVRDALDYEPPTPPDADDE